MGVQDLCWLYGSSCTNNRILQALRRLFLMQVVEVPWIALIAARAYIKLWWCVNLEDLELGDMGIWSGFFEVSIVFGFSLKKQLQLLVCFCTYFCRHLQLLLCQVEPPSSKKAKFNPFQVHFIDQILHHFSIFEINILLPPNRDLGLSSSKLNSWSNDGCLHCNLLTKMCSVLSMLLQIGSQVVSHTEHECVVNSEHKSSAPTVHFEVSHVSN